MAFTPNIIVDSNNADFSQHVYTSVYAGTNTTVTINGVSVTMGAGSSIDIIVKSITPTSGVYLIGTNKSAITG